MFWEIIYMLFSKKIHAIYAVETRPKKVAVNRHYDVPYFAGYSIDGNTVYIDSDFPDKIKIGEKEISVDEFLEVHELTEKTLEDRLGYIYPPAHKLATKAEEERVREKGISPKMYEEALKAYIEHAYAKRHPKLPPDLDSTPYVKDKRYKEFF
jgi:hypothetical protein